jgi:L-ascorbate metabolism protein UlaG (beta-lactamase superfamily)
MRVRWYGQSAFALVEGAGSVFIDPFGDWSPPANGV